MAAISEDYLNSMSADERDDFLKNIFDVFSMNSSKRDEIVAQKIREMYKDHQGKLIKCTFCRKDEPEDQEFGRMYIFLT
jgi:transcription elongation factor GreA-like protein